MTSQEPSAADVMTMAMQERGDFAGCLETLTPRQGAPSLCGDLTVWVSYEELSWAGAVKRFACRGFTLSETHEIVIRGYSRSRRELIDLLRTHQRPRGLTAARSGMTALLDAMIHQQDIRRPLALSREIPGDRLRTALRLALTAPPIGAPQRARGLTLVATDLDWSRGSGPELRGPGEALLMALAGRGDTLGELSGPGQARLPSGSDDRRIHKKSGRRSGFSPRPPSRVLRAATRRPSRPGAGLAGALTGEPPGRSPAPITRRSTARTRTGAGAAAAGRFRFRA
ncbi:hypothetical protein [Amycolatopsis sp. FDAARGOS 1241]|uniref:hypothetical protein n=1 Tax=Amycolatopsis sp. FDAARGOS 1241 TaxID=2778070 RepID=UPI00351C8C66